MGVIEAGKIRWRCWREVGQAVDNVARELRARGIVRQSLCTPPPGNDNWLLHDLAAHRLGAFCVPNTGLAQPANLPDDTAALVGTSGTSGTPRTVVLSHKNLLSNTLAVAQTIAASLGDVDDSGEVRLSFLPFHHLYARVCDLYCWLHRGSRMVLAESRETIFRDCQIAKPTTINGVPYFFQKAIDQAQQQGITLQELLGGNLQRCYSGGAALSEGLQQRFADAGIPLLNGYGLSEASPVVTVSTVRDQKPGTVGKPLPGVDVQIADDGELLIRGPGVMQGYAGSAGVDSELTAEVLRDGWLHTGDLGEIDGDGFLKIVGRKKELIALSTGKKVSPSRLEALLAASPWIEQVAVIGEGQPCLAALIVPNPERVRAEIRRRRLWVWSKRRALSHPTIRSLFAQEIQNLLADAESYEQVREFMLIGRGFSAEAGEMTSKLSLRRQVIAKNFRREIERLYLQRGGKRTLLFS